MYFCNSSFILSICIDLSQVGDHVEVKGTVRFLRIMEII